MGTTAQDLCECPRTNTLPEPKVIDIWFNMSLGREDVIMYGVFGGYTRWAVVFLIIFVLFFLLVPAYGYGAGAAGGAGAAVAAY